MRSARAVFVLVPFLLSAYALYSITFVLGDLATALHTTIEGITLAVTLSWVGGAVGGLAFGVLADRWSRKGALLIAILLFSVATTLTYLVRDLPELYALWFLVGFGVNGENGISYVILAEASFTSLRGLNGGLVQGTYDLGVLLGALTASLVGGWREVFLVAGLAGLLGVPFWVGVESTHRRSKRVPLTSIFRGGLLRLTVVGSALSLSSLLLVVALFSLAPTILSTERGYYSAIVVGALLSTVAYALAGYASDLWGRRRVAIVLAAAAVATSIAFSLAALSPPAPLWSYPQTYAVLASYVTSSFFAFYGVWMGELYPAEVRATGTNFDLLVGRLVGGSLGPLIVVALPFSLGISLGVVMTVSSIVAVASAVLIR